MAQFIVYRHGSNAANQSMCNLRILGLYESATEEKAKDLAGREHTVYNNQYLTAKLLSKASRLDRDTALELWALANKAVPAAEIHCTLCGQQSPGDLSRKEAEWWLCEKCT